MRTYLTTLKRGAQSLAGILADFSSVEKAMNTMENAAGSADREMNIIRDSLEFKINALKQTWVGTLTEITDRGELGGIIDFGTKISEGIGGIISKVGLLQTALTGLFAVIGSQKLGLLSYDKFTNKFGWGENGLLGTLNEMSTATVLSQQDELFLQKIKSLSGQANLDINTLAKSYEGVNKQLVEFTNQHYLLGESLDDIGKKFVSQNSIMTKSISIVKSLGATLVNAFGSAIIGYAISEFITIISNMATSMNDLAKSSQEFSAKFVDGKQKISSYKDEISGLRDTLANQDATTEEVAEATSELYKIQNDLVNTYGAYANGLDLVNGKLTTQLQILEDIEKTNAQQAVNDINAQTSGLSKGVNALTNLSLKLNPIGLAVTTVNDLKTFAENIRDGGGLLDSIVGTYTDSVFGQNIGDKLLGTSEQQLTDYFENFNKTIKNVDVDAIDNIVDNLEGLSIVNGDLKVSGSVDEVSNSILILQSRLQEVNASGEFDSLINELGGIYSEAKKIETLNGDNYETIMFNKMYNPQNESALKYYRKIEEAYEDVQSARETGTYEDIQKAQDEYGKLINKIQDSSELDEQFKSFFENLYPDLQNIVSQWELEVKIVPTIDEGADEYLKSHTYEEVMADYAKSFLGQDNTYKDIFDYMSSQASASGYSTMASFVQGMKSFTQYSDNMLYAKNLLGGDEESASKLTDEELAIAATIKPRYTEESQREYEETIDKLPDFVVDNLDISSILEVDPYSITELKELIEEKLNPLDVEIDPEVKSSDVVSRLNQLEDEWDALSTVYDTTVTNKKTASSNDIQSVNDDFGGIKDDNNAYTTLSNALEAYNDKLTENAGDTEIAQKAADELATAYIDLNGTLVDLDEDHVEYYEDILKEKGVENAHEVVLSRLNKTYKATRLNLEKLADAVAAHNDELEKSEKTADDFNNSFSDITDAVANLIGVYDQDTGEFVGAADIDGQFVADNWGLVQDAIEGVDGATDALYAKYAKLKAEEIYIKAGIDATELESKVNNIGNLLDIANSWTMEPEALLKNDEFMSALNACWDGSVTTANAINAALSTIGMKVEYKTTPKKIKTASTGSKTTSIYDGSGSVVNWDWVEVDDFEVVSTPTGKGSTGTGVNNYSGGSNSSSSSGGSGGSDSGSSDDTDTTEETFDWIEVKIERLEEELDHLDKIASNVYNSWSKRNQTIADEISKTTAEIKLQEDAAERYLTEANKYGDLIGEDYKQKVQEGVIDIETIKLEVSSDSDEDTLIDNIQNYQTWWEKYKDAKNNAVTLTEDIMNYHKDIFDNIQSQYESLIDNLDKQNDILEERVTRAEEMGFFTDKSYYEEMLKIEQSTNGRIEQLQKEREELINKLNNAMDSGFIQPESEGWWEMYDAIQDVNQQLEEAYTNVEKLKKEIEQLAWDKFDWLEERLSDITAESDFLIKLLQGENNFDDQGNFTNRGYSQAALVAVKYDDALERAERYKDEIAKIDAEMAKDDRKADKDLVERKETLVQAYRDAIEAAEDEKQAMVSLVTEGINKQLEALKKLIDEYKESLSAAKDLYTYQKNLSNQTQNLADLQKQLAAYQNDDSEEARKKRQELQAQIESAEEQLEETQWDRYISETGEVLDNLYETYEEFLNEKLEQHLVLMNHMIDLINQNGTSVAAGLDEIREEYNMTTLHFEGFGETANSTLNGVKGISDTTKTISTNISKLVEKSTDIYKKFTNGSVDTPLSSIGKIIQDTWKTLNVVVSTDTNGTLNQVEKNSKDITYNKNTGKVSVKDSKNNNTSASTSGGGGGTKPTDKDKDKESGKLVGQLGRWRGDWDSGYWYEYDDGSYPKDTAVTIAGKEYYFDPNGYVLADQYVKGRFYGKDGAWDGGETSEWKQDDTGWWYESQSGNYPTNSWVLIDGDWYYFGSNGYAYTGKTSVGTFDSNGRWLGYAKGTRHVPKDQLALTQEEGSELIYKTDTGAMLTPLNQGDMVFTHEMSQRLWQIASGEIPMTTLGKLTAKLPNVKNGNITANSNITFNLPNVTNAEQFMNELTQSSRFEKIIQEISIGQLVGNNKLNKYKY